MQWLLQMTRLLLAVSASFLPNSLCSSEKVYCIHGFMRTPSSMQPMAQTFEESGYLVTNWGYSSRTKTISEHTADLLSSVSDAAAKNPGTPIHLVTHSLGGIIALSLHNHPDCPAEVKQGKIVMLAPPMKGSAFARCLNKVGPIRTILGKHTGKELLSATSFEHLGSFPRNKQILVISGTFGWNPFVGQKNDGKVGIFESCPDIVHVHYIHFTSHSWMMKNKTVILNALDFIDSNPVD